MLRRILAVLLAAIVPAVPAQAQEGGVLGMTLVDSYVHPKGAFVNIVRPGGPAAAAGVNPGDVVIAVDGTAVDGAEAMKTLVVRHRAGESVTLRVVAAGNHPARDIRIVYAGRAQSGSATAGKNPVAARAPDSRVNRSSNPVATIANAPARAIAQWTRFVDPVEHSFYLDVPAGWRVQGGSRRMSAVEIRAGVEAESPDRSIRIFYGDADVPIFTVPSPLLSSAGFRPGSTYSPGYGQQFTVMPYLDGEQFALRWGARRVGRTCGGVRPLRANSRADASRGIDAAYASFGIRNLIRAGEATFACTRDGGANVGYVFAATELVQSPQGALWDVKTYVGFVASQSSAAQAYALLGHIVASFSIDPNWATRQQQTVARTSRLVAQTNRIVSNSIAETSRRLAATSDMIVKGGAARSAATSNAIDRYDQGAVRGTSTYVDSSTGTTRTLDNSHAHQYVNNRGETRGTDSEYSPGPGWTELRQVQPGR